MPAKEVDKLCQATPTVSSEFAKNPNQSPTEIVKRLHGHFKSSTKTENTEGDAAAVAAAELEQALRCGQWGPQQPSDLFLKIYHDALQCLTVDPLASMASPPLMGSHGTIPLTVIAPLADLARHMSNVIVRAEKEVFLITCSWSPSVATRLISDALKELSRRAGKRGDRVVVKVMFDKAGPSHLINNRQSVPSDVYSGYSSLNP